MPLVLTYITCRNYERYLEICYKSAVMQVFAHDLGIVYHAVRVAHDNCGGGSGHGPAWMRNRIRTGLNPKPDYIIFLDADDWIPATYVSELLRTANGDPCVVACDSHLFGDESRKVPVQRPITFDGILEGNSIHCSALIPYQHFQTSYGFDEALTSHEDWDLWLNLLSAGVEFRYCPSTHLNYRRHSDSRSAQDRSFFQRTRTIIQKRYEVAK